MLEAEDVLGHGHDQGTATHGQTTGRPCLGHGWDEIYGGLFQDGTTLGKPQSKLKEWWVQMEGLNSLLLMHEKYGRDTDVYFKAPSGNGSSSGITRPTPSFTESIH